MVLYSSVVWKVVTALATATFILWAAATRSLIKINKNGHAVKDEEKDKYMMDHLHELVNVTAHHLVRRNARNFPHLPGGKELVGTVHGRLDVRPNAGTNFLFPLARHFLLLERTSHLLNRNARRCSQTLVQIKGRWTILSPPPLSPSPFLYL